MNKRAAFTMVEILLALGIFVVGIFAIVSVFPRANEGVITSEDKTISARFADSLINAIVQGARSYDDSIDFTGDTVDSIYPDEVVYFTFNLNKKGTQAGTHQDFFLLPKAPSGTGPTYAPTDIDVVWYPTALPSAGFPIDYTAGVDVGQREAVGSNKVDGTNGFDGKVRRLGRAALGSSGLDEDITSTEEIFPERLKDFYFCFSVQRAEDKKKTGEYFSNLYKITLYLYHQGVNLTSVTAGAEQDEDTIYVLIDKDDPTSKANNFIDKFDFLVNINKSN